MASKHYYIASVRGVTMPEHFRGVKHAHKSYPDAEVYFVSVSGTEKSTMMVYPERGDSYTTSLGMGGFMVKKIDRACANNKLENHVILWLNEQGRGYDNGAEGAFNDLMQGGCASGIVGHLIYYKDTIRFYKTHRDTIAEYLKELMGETGINNPSELFSNWDKDDPLALDDYNQNLLAWFGFEEAAARVIRCAGIDY